MQFKKMAAMAGSALMAGLTIATPVLGSAVSEVGKISDLVTVADSTVSFPMFVVGASASTADVLGAANVAAKLAGEAVATEMIAVSGSGTSTTVTGGVQIGTVTNPLSVGRTLNTIRSSAFDVSDLPVLLATNTFQPIGESSVEYKQYLTIDGGATTQIVYEKQSGEDEPTLRVKVSKSNIFSMYELLFSTDVTYTADTADTALTGQTLNILGQDYVISNVKKSSGVITELTILGGKNTHTISTGTDKTVTIGGKDYIIQLTAVVTTGSALKAIGNVNGEDFDLLQGATMTLSDGTKVAAVSVTQGKTGESDFVKITIGADEITLPANGAISNPDYNSAIVSTITSTTTSLSKINITYTPEDDVYLNEGDSIQDEFAKAFSLDLTGFVPSLEDETNRQVMSFMPDGDQMNLRYENANGVVQDVPLVWYNVSSLTDAANNQTWKWGTEDKALVFDGASTISAESDDYVIVQKSGYSHVLQFIGLDNKTAGGSTLKYDVRFKELGNADTEIVGSTDTDTDGTFRVGTNDYPFHIVDATIGNRTIRVGVDGAGFAATDVSFLMPGLITDGDGALVLGGNTTQSISTPGSYNVTLTQEKDQADVQNTIAFLIGYSSDQTYVSSTSSSDSTYSEITVSGGTGETRALSKYGTLVSRFTAAEGGEATVSYPDTYLVGNVFVMTPEGMVTQSAGTDGSEVESTTVLPITADITKLDTEVTDADKAANDFILVGGPCVNTLVAELATAGKFANTCEGWPAENFGLIELVADAFTEGNTALIIAGTRAADTDLAARVVQDGSKLAGKTGSSARVTGESFASVVVA